VATSTADRPARVHGSGPASVAYDAIPYRPRTWRIPNVAATGETTVIASDGGKGKGITVAMLAALTVLGLPMPGDAPGTVRTPGRVLWVSSGTEDDPIHDLSWRFSAALRACAAKYGLEEHDALLAARFIHDLSGWEDGSPFALPADLPALVSEAAALNALDEYNRAPADEHWAGNGPSVALVIADPLTGVLGEGSNVRSPEGARAVATACNQFAQAADVAFIVIHHLNAGGKMGGSPALVNAVRIALTIQETGIGGIRVLTRYKTNISSDPALRFTVTGGEPDGYALFLEPSAAAETTPLGCPTLRARIAACAPVPGASKAGPGTGPLYRAVRRVKAADGTAEPVASLTPAGAPTRAAARAAAEADAGRALHWSVPAGLLTDEATVTHAGRITAYGVYLEGTLAA